MGKFMKDSEQIFANDLITKIDNEYFKATEYYLCNNKFINIIVNQSTENFDFSFKKIIEYLIDNNYEILSQFLFGNSYFEKENRDLAKKYFQSLSWPVTVIKQNGNTWGTLIKAINTDRLETIYQNSIVIGKHFKDEYADYILLEGLENNPKNISKEESVKSIFQCIESELKKIEMDFKNVVRTWFYLNDIVSWYDKFNTLRSNYFEGAGIFNNMIPASTGIGATSNNNSNLLSLIFAVNPKNNNVKISPVISPLQCPAVYYKSAFSRAVEINHPKYKQLIISGTASINPDGQSAHIGDIYGQIKLTMEVVNQILVSKNMNWENVTKGFVYFKDINDIKTFYYFCSNNKIPLMPLVMLQAGICRDELLFEIEMDAIELNNN